jgi:hypothetical protein
LQERLTSSDGAMNSSRRYCAPDQSERIVSMESSINQPDMNGIFAAVFETSINAETSRQSNQKK